MVNQANEILQIVTSTLLGLVSILLVRHARSGQNTWAGIGFTISILCYVIVGSEVVRSLPLLRIVASIGAICVPALFWLLARAIFDDHFKFQPALLLWFLILIVPHLNFFVDHLVPWPGFRQLSGIVARLTSLGFVLAALYTALRTKQADLVDSRIQFRNIFLLMTATLIAITLIVEIIPIHHDTVAVLQLLQRLAIMAITVYFLVSNFAIRSGFFFREISKPKPLPVDDPHLTARLQALMEEQKAYKKEGLTIGELAALMNVQEYRLRRLINGQLGFRNFNDFLNQYRVNEACEILSDPGQTRKTILEIAYDLGYQSIGPFNKAFKDLKGATPKAYRKSQIN
ncbi:MAG: helix-turn-helix domain-containing protein [Bacteroidota bacterium]